MLEINDESGDLIIDDLTINIGGICYEIQLGFGESMVLMVGDPCDQD